jgi:hypothetical protein
MLGDTSPVLVAVFTLLTFGLYLPVWYLGRLSRLNALNPTAKLSSRSAYVLLGLYLVNASGVLSFVGGSDIQSALMLNTLGHALTLVTGMILISLRLRVREILRDQYGPRFSAQAVLSWIASVILGEIYLQAKMNRLPSAEAAQASVPMARPAQVQW